MLCRPTNRGITVLAPAKLNLFLRVVARRADGFHEIESVMAAINLYDSLTFERLDSDRIELDVVDASTRSAYAELPLEAPAGPSNLVVRAAILLKEYANCPLGARICLVKKIPSSAGLGGGSSDCAAALTALNRLWNLNVPRSALIELAGRLGSDVPFFLTDSAVALCTGRGEQIEPFRVSTGLHFVVAKTATGLSTPAVYRSCQPDTTGQRVDAFMKAMESGAICRMARRLHNGLQPPAEALSNDVRRLRSLFEQLPVVGHQMSGSGSAYFGICWNRQQALQIASHLRAARIPWVKVVRSCP